MSEPTKMEAERDALQLQLDIERAGAVEMARVIAALRAQQAEFVSAYDEYMAAPLNDALQEWEAMTKRLNALRNAAVVARVEPDAAKDEPITAETLAREGWELVDVDKTARQFVIERNLGWRALTWFNDGTIVAHDDEAVVFVPNCKTMADLRHLVRLMSTTTN